MTTASLLSVQIGRIAPLGPDGIASGFIKSAVDGPIAVTPLGLDGDEQADLAVHGGAEKAVYAYPSAHYRDWIADFPDHAALFVAGGVGENLTVDGWTERDLCVGDVHAVGTARLQVCQPRQPCFKFALRFGDKMLPKAMVRTGRAGWYYRVLQPGTIRAGDGLALEERPNPGFGFDRLVAIVNFRNPSRDDLEAMAAMTGLASGLREGARRALIAR